MNLKKKKSHLGSVEAYACSCGCSCSCNCVTCSCPGAQPPNPPQYGNHNLPFENNHIAVSRVLGNNNMVGVMGKP